MLLTEKLEREIIESLVALENAIGIIEQAKNTGLAISATESEFIDNLSLIQTKELISLMLENKTRKRNAKLATAGTSDARYQPFLISDEKTLDKFVSYLAGLPAGQAYYFDFILRPKDSHSSAMQIYSDGVKPRSFYFESTADINKKFRIAINKAINAEEHNYVAGGILNADYGCTIFSIQNLNAMRRLIQERNYLNQDSQLKDLDPVFLKNTQSLVKLQEYTKNNSEKPLYVNKRKTRTLAEHIENFAVSTEIISGNDIIIKKRNYASLYKTRKYLASAFELLISLNNDEEKLNEILYNRSPEPILNSVYDQMGLNEDERNYVQGLFNQEQIKLSLKYQIPPEAFKDSICFQNHDNSKFIYNYIENYEDKDSNKAKDILFAVKKCSNIVQLKLILEENINPQKIHSIGSFENAEIAPILYDFITNSKVLYGKDGVNAALATLEPMTYNMNINTVTSLKFLTINQLLSFAIISQNALAIRAWIKAGCDINKITPNPIDSAISTKNIDIIGEVTLAGAKINESQIAILKENYPTTTLLRHFKKAIDQENVEAIFSFININPQLITSKLNNLDIMEYLEPNNKTKLLKIIAATKVKNAPLPSGPDPTPSNGQSLIIHSSK